MQVTINEKEGFVTVENNGHGLPLEAHLAHLAHYRGITMCHLTGAQRAQNVRTRACRDLIRCIEEVIPGSVYQKASG